MCPNCKCNGQKQIMFTPNNFQLEGAEVKNARKTKLKRTERKWNKIIKPGLKLASPYFSANRAAKTKYPQSAEFYQNS